MTRMVVTVATHPGLVRPSNQDRVVVGPWVLGPDYSDIAALICPSQVPLAAVCDGMGGHAGGEIAASLAAELMASLGAEIKEAEAAAEVVNRANAAIYRRMFDLPQLSGMGSTLAGITLVEDDAILFSVGDSRIYAEVDGYLLPVSTDDASLSGALTQSLGGRPAYESVSAHVLIEPACDRRFLLATDGLFGHLDIQTLERCLEEDDAMTVRALLHAALAGGGPDNVSVVLVRFVSDPPSDEAAG